MSDYIRPVLAVVLPNVGGFLGSRLTYGSIKPKSDGPPSWFEALKAPKFKPPSWVFPPVWTALYSSMGYASYMVWRDGGGFDGDALLPLTCYGTQLALNWAWSPIFFGYHKLGLATIEIGVLWGAVLATILTFQKVNPTASYMLLPYLGWISFASYLTFSYWRLNKDRKD